MAITEARCSFNGLLLRGYFIKRQKSSREIEALNA